MGAEQRTSLEETMSGRYAYSLDRETFLGQFETRADALRAALTAARQKAEPPTEVFVGRKTEGDPQVCGHAEGAIETMRDRARTSNDGGDRYLRNINEQEEADLDDMLAGAITDWLKKHDRMPTFYSVEAISEHPVPQSAHFANRNGDSEVTEIGTSDSPYAGAD
jgi:hypothetical protein